MGSFPIQSNTSCAEEWIINKKTRLLVDPNNIEEIKTALREALCNDLLVDKASIINNKKIKDELNFASFKKEVLNLYNKLLK